MSGPRMTDESFEALWRASGESSNTIRLAREAKRARAAEAELRGALMDLVRAEDRFVREAGVPMTDDVARAVENARAAIAQATTPRTGGA